MDTAYADGGTDETEKAAPVEKPPSSVLEQGPASEAQKSLPTTPSAAPEGVAELASLAASISAAQPDPSRAQQAIDTERQNAAIQPAGNPATAQNPSPRARLASASAAGTTAPATAISSGMTPQLTGITSQNAARPEAREKIFQDLGRSTAPQILSLGQSAAEQSVTTSIPISPPTSGVALTLTSPEVCSLSPRSLAQYKYWKDRASQNEPLPSNFQSPSPAPQPSLPAGSGSSNPAVAKAAPQSRAPAASNGLNLLSAAPNNEPAPAGSALPAAASAGIPVTTWTVTPPSLSSPSPAANPLLSRAQRPQVPLIQYKATLSR